MAADARAAGGAVAATLGVGFGALGVSLQATDPMIGAAVATTPALVGTYLGRELVDSGPSAETEVTA